jgi:acyl-CoA thioester hydrolase
LPEFKFFHTLEVRYADIDSLNHVNNATYFTYMEQARVRYLQAVGIWDSTRPERGGIILADEGCTFIEPVTFGQVIKVGVAATRLGNKSFALEYSLMDEATGREVARGRSVQVAYDYAAHRSVRLPERWRAAISRFEGFEDLD